MGTRRQGTKGLKPPPQAGDRDLPGAFPGQLPAHLPGWGAQVPSTHVVGSSLDLLVQLVLVLIPEGGVAHKQDVQDHPWGGKSKGLTLLPTAPQPSPTDPGHPASKEHKPHASHCTLSPGVQCVSPGGSQMPSSGTLIQFLSEGGGPCLKPASRVRALGSTSIPQKPAPPTQLNPHAWDVNRRGSMSGRWVSTSVLDLWVSVREQVMKILINDTC